MRLINFSRFALMLVFLFVVSNNAYATGYFWWFGAIYFSTPDPFAFHQVKGVDLATFKVLQVKGKDSSVGKDKFHVYYWYSEVVGADPDTFELIDEAYGKDFSSVFYMGKRIPDADPSTFVVISNTYGKDSRQCYRALSSFRVKEISSFRFATELYTEFRHAYVENNEVFTRDNEDYYYFDGSSVFAMETTSPDNLRIVRFDQSASETGIWTTDGAAYFCRGRKVPSIDIASFRILNSFFSKDKFSVFYIDQKVEGADLSSFEVDSGNAQVGHDRFTSYWRNKPKSEIQ